MMGDIQTRDQVALEALAKRIPPELRTAFLISFSAAFLVHLYDIVNFPLGNHDWFRLENMIPGAQMQAGRVITALSYFLTLNKTIPLLYYLGVACMSMSGILAVYYIFRTKNIYILTFGGIFISTIPYVTALLYYKSSSFQFFLAPLLALCALISLEGRNISRFVFGVILAFCSLATYGLVVGTIAVAASARTIILCQSDDKEVLPFVARTALGILCALATYFVYVKLTGYFLGSFYNTQSRGLAEMIGLVPRVFGYGVVSLSPATSHAYFPMFIKVIMVALLGLAAGLSLLVAVKKNLRLAALTVAALLAMVFGLKVYALLTPAIAWNAHRGMFFGVGFAFLFGAGYLVTYPSRSIRMTGMILTAACLWVFVVEDMRAAQHLRLSQDHDIQFMNRVVARIEQLPAYGSRPLDYFQVGDLPNFRSQLIASETQFLDPPFNATSEHPSRPGNLVNYLTDGPWGQMRYVDRPHGLLSDKKLNYQILYYAQSHAWPDKGAVVQLGQDTVVVVLGASPGRLKPLLNRLRSELVSLNFDVDQLEREVDNGIWLAGNTAH